MAKICKEIHDSFKIRRRDIAFIFVGVILSTVFYSVTNSFHKFSSETGKKNYRMFVENDDGEYVEKVDKEFPKDGYILDTSKSVCSNNAALTQNLDKTITVDTPNSTKCTLYFKRASFVSELLLCKDNAANCIKKNAYLDRVNLIAQDETDDKNTRYIGSNPNNHVSFNGEDWRIIGVFNNIDDGTGVKNARVKLIRSSSIGRYSWDTTVATTNNGNGINEWSQADLMDELNNGPYYNRTNGTCYRGGNNATTNCNFTSNGLTEEARNLIDNATWYLGTNKANDDWTDDLTPKVFYNLERGNLTGKQCTSNNYCNDDIARTTTWVGKVGLISPSEFGFATSGSAATTRDTCLNTTIGYKSNGNHWGNSVSDCKNNDWLYSSSEWRWTMLPRGNSSRANFAMYIGASGNLSNDSASSSGAVLPVVYLKSDVKITSGDGSGTNPYILNM